MYSSKAACAVSTWGYEQMLCLPVLGALLVSSSHMAKYGLRFLENLEVVEGLEDLQ